MKEDPFKYKFFAADAGRHVPCKVVEWIYQGGMVRVERKNGKRAVIKKRWLIPEPEWPPHARLSEIARKVNVWR